MGDRRRRAVRVAVAPGDNPVTTAADLLGERRDVGARRAPARAHLERTLALGARARAVRERRRAARPRCCTTSSARCPIRARRSTPRATGRWTPTSTTTRAARPGISRAGWPSAGRLRTRSRPPSRSSRCTSGEAGPRPICCRRPTRSRSSRRSRRSCASGSRPGARRRRARSRSSTSCGIGSRVPGGARARPRALRERARGGRVTRWLWPETLAEAVELRASLGDDALPVAGGTFVGVLAQTGFLDLPESVIALGRVEGLAGIERDGDELVIGAMATHAEIERSEVVRDGWQRARGVLRRGRERARAQRRDDRRRARRRRLRERSARDAAGARRPRRAREPGRHARPRRRRAHPRPLRHGDRARRADRARARPAAARGGLREVPLALERGPAVRRRWPRRGSRTARSASRSAPSATGPCCSARSQAPTLISDLRGSAGYRRRMVDVHARRARAMLDG